jgi:alpha-galactosidase
MVRLVGVVRGRLSGLVAAACALAGCDRTILLGARPSNTSVHPDASPADATPPLDAPADHAPGEDCSASIPEGLLAATPPMGWNGWNTFNCENTLDEAKVLATVDALVSSGMHAAGYQYVNFDDCWQTSRLPDGTIEVNQARFPNGILPVSTYVHDKGFSFGLYSPTANCISTPGSDGYETKDAQTYAAYGADYLKYRICSPVDGLQARYERMAQALRSTGRAIVYSIAAPPFSDWMAEMGQLWRTGPSITATWDGLMRALDLNVPLAPWTRPGGFNDPDMLEVGNGTLSESENRANFTLWSIMSAPLLAGNDLTVMTESTREILTNSEIIALDQDPLGLQGAPVRHEADSADVLVLAKPLASCGARGVVLFNRGVSTVSTTVSWSDIWLLSGPAVVRDLWAHVDRDPVIDGITVSIPPHDVVALKVLGTEPPRPTGDAYLSDLSWTYASNGWGPIERDTSNGEIKAGDGAPMRLRGRTYMKGLGAHAPSLVRYRLQQACTRFTADVGIDDEVAGLGSVAFEVWADGQKLFDSGVVTGTTPVRHIDLDLKERRDLRLFVGTGAENQNGQDHADWADARLTCR